MYMERYIINETITVKVTELVKFVMCNMVSRVHMTFYILKKRHTVLGNQGTHDKLNQIRNCNLELLLFGRIKQPPLSSN